MRETGYPNLFTDALQTRFRSQGLQCTDEQFRTLWKRHYRLRLLDPIASKDIVPDVDFWFDVFGKQGLPVTREMIRGLAQQCLDEDGEKIGGLTYENGDFGFMVSKACTGRRFVVTKTGYGDGPEGDGEGRCDCSFLGGDRRRSCFIGLMILETCEKGIGTSS